MSNQFDWVPIYREFAMKLTEYAYRRQDLIEMIKEVFSRTGIKMPTLEKNNQLVDMDPFTVFGLFNKGIQKENRDSILQAFKDMTKGEKKMRNYVMYGKTLFGRQLLYAYLDLPENLAAGVLAKHRPRVRLQRVLMKEDEKYILVEARVRREDRQKFLDAMEDLKTKMLIFGYGDYETHGGKLIRDLEDEIFGETRQDKKRLSRMGLEDQNIVIADG